ncbi:unnamed protein product [Brassica oleracea]
MFIALTLMPLPAMSESYEACYERCIHDCVGIKCHKTHVLPRMEAKKMFQEIHT